MQDIYTFIDQKAETYIEWLRTLLHQPSVAAQNIGLDETAAMVVDLMERVGISAQRVPAGRADVVVGNVTGESSKTLGFYNHYDVQPPEPLDLWHSDPWAAEIRDGRIWARGVADNKGNLVARIAAYDAWRALRGKPPINLRYIVEGGEEIGSPDIAKFADDYPEHARTDAYIWEFGGRGPDGTPQMFLGLKGMCYVELRIRGANADQHSSTATSIPNAAWRMIWALNTLKGPDEKVLIPGYYDNVVPPNEEDLAVLERMPDTEAIRLNHLGIDGFLLGLTGLDIKVRDYFQPTRTVAGIVSGYTGQGSKTVLPSYAMAKIDMRLVAKQDPDDIFAKIRAHFDANGFEDMEMTALSMSRPARTPVNAPIANVVAETYREVYQQEPVIIPTSGGSGPWDKLCARFGIDACTAGVGNHQSNAHAPNENIVVDDFILGIKHIAAIIDRFGHHA